MYGSKENPIYRRAFTVLVKKADDFLSSIHCIEIESDVGVRYVVLICRYENTSRSRAFLFVTIIKAVMRILMRKHSRKYIRAAKFQNRNIFSITRKRRPLFYNLNIAIRVYTQRFLYRVYGNYTLYRIWKSVKVTNVNNNKTTPRNFASPHTNTFIRVRERLTRIRETT